MSIPKHARREYSVPQLDLDATAIALGGYISEVKAPPEAPEYTACRVPIVGAACALPLGGDGAFAEVVEGTTLFDRMPLVRFARAQAEVALGQPGNRTAVVARTRVENLILGTKHALTIGHAEVEQSARNLRCTFDFKLHAAINDVSFGGEKLPAIRLDVADLPRTYEQLVEALPRLGEFLLPHSEFRPGVHDAKSGKTIALHLVRDLPWSRLQVANGNKTAPNGFYLENFGQVYFGELLVTPTQRRFTAFRFVFGCDQGGGGSGGDTRDGGTIGTYYP